MAQLQFKGKGIISNHHLAVPFHELVPDKKKGLSDKPRLDDNLIVHGDNLLALKALLPTYAGKVKCIYIDPPYNTGHEGWAYNDNVSNPMMKDWLGKTVDVEDLTRHDKWLCMMMPRLKLLRELLSDDGAIFVSIDDNEQHRLRMLMDEIFGEENFISALIWTTKNAARGVPPTNMLMDNHEYVLCFSKTSEGLRFKGVKREEDDFANPDNDVRGLWRSESIKATGKQNNIFEIKEPKTGRVFKDNWAFSKDKIAEMISKNFILFPDKDNGTPRQKKFIDSYLNENKAIVSFLGWYSTENSTKQLMDIFGGEKKFDFPKPIELIEFLIGQIVDSGDIILDSFAGSGTTAHAVLALNKEDGGNRKFILVEMEDYADAITAERVRRVIKGVKGAKDENLKKGLGGSFSYFDLGKAIDERGLLSGKSLPTYEEMARYIFHVATGEAFDAKKLDKKRGFVGESGEFEVYLLYEPDVAKLKELALTLPFAKGLGKSKAKKRLVFAPTKYLDPEDMAEYRIEFAQLPFEIYRRLA